MSPTSPSPSTVPIKLNFVVGTAAELIKIYPVLSMALTRGHEVRVVSTGQSRENFFMQFRDLQLNDACLTLLLSSEGDLTGARAAMRWMLRAVSTSPRAFRKKLITGEKSYVVVHGDTLSTLVGSILGWRSGLSVVHIEAGLRSSSLVNPFPEEITRRLVSRIASFHMAPDPKSLDNLRRARVRGRLICTQGNTLLDTVKLSSNWNEIQKEQEPFALVNIHRFENLQSPERWQSIIATVVKASERVRIIFVMHPQTRHRLEQDPSARDQLDHSQIELRDRMPFTQFIALLKQAQFLITDGGSNQEESSYLGKPCLILRENTERQEGLGSCCVLSRFNPQVINDFLADPTQFGGSPLHPEQCPSAIILDSLE